MRQKVSRTMSNYYIRSLQHALDIIAAYEHCGSCDRCPLSTPEGFHLPNLGPTVTQLSHRSPPGEQAT